MGNVLKKTGWSAAYLVSTKIFWGGNGPNDSGLSHKHVIEGVHAALDRLQLDYVDLCFCHRPDPDTPIEETVRAMDVLVRPGQGLLLGHERVERRRDPGSAHGIARQDHGLTPPTMEQPQYNMLGASASRASTRRSSSSSATARPSGARSPRACSRASTTTGSRPGSRLDAPTGYGGSRRWSLDDEAHASPRSRKLAPIAAELGCTLAQLAIAWCLANPHVSTVITGASRAEQVRENLKAIDVASRLTPAMLDRIEQILGNRPAPEKDWR